MVFVLISKTSFTTKHDTRKFVKNVIVEGGSQTTFKPNEETFQLFLTKHVRDSPKDLYSLFEKRIKATLE
jgi:hypothetical protein